mgnify:CR=1 FL=1|tara:strand:- start:3239 stop:5065 length:1827 start_codon:yes stop_codon:yes gene_type:complete
MITLKKLSSLLSSKDKKWAFLVLIMIIFMAFFDVIGIASIAPFIAALSNPEIILTNEYLYLIHTSLGYEDENIGSFEPGGFLFFLGLVVFLLLLFSVAFKAMTTYIYERFAAYQNFTLSKKLVQGYLTQDYPWFLNKHSSDIGKTVLSEVNVVITGSLLPLMKLISNLAVVIAMLLLVILLDPLIAFITGLGIGSIYMLIYFMLRKLLGFIGEDRVKANEERFKIIQEGFGGIKEVKIYGLESMLIERFKSPAERFASHTATQHIAGQLPRFLLEVVAFGGMLLLVLVLMAKNESLAETLPVLAVFAFAGYRLMPSMQQVFAQLTQIRFTRPALERLHADIVSLEESKNNLILKNNAFISERINLNKHILIEKVNFKYEASDSNALEDLSLRIPAGSLTGIVGGTGSGKTTTADLILGLLRPNSGRLVIDDTEITKENIGSWQRSIGYVPQNIYLIDDSFFANIGFGLANSDIDKEKVKAVSKIANLDEFITKLPDKYETHIGERGVRLSGGQRQRIGIARALYYDPEVLIFDEATSALDNITERTVMEAINNLGNEKTIIIIAHRISTVKNCDQIFVLDDARLSGEGSYDELYETNSIFREMVSVNE